MDNNLITIIKGVGLNEKEARIYLALLELGHATIGEIALVASLKRTTIYPIIEQLKARTIVFETTINAKKSYHATDPANLLTQLQTKTTLFEKNLQLLHNHRAESPTTPSHVQFFNGADGFKEIWHTLFASGEKEYLIMTDPREMLQFFKKNYIQENIIKEKITRGIKSRQLIVYSEYAKEILAKDRAENRTSKILPHTHKLPFTTIIFGQTVALISPAPENLILVITSPAYAKTERSIFEALWEQLPTPKISPLGKLIQEK